MTSNRNQTIRVISIHCNAKELIYPDKAKEDKNNSSLGDLLKKELLQRLIFKEAEGLVRDKSSKLKLSEEALQQELASGSYACCVVATGDEPEKKLLAYKFYKKLAPSFLGKARKTKGTLIDFAIGSNIAVDDHEKFRDLLNQGVSSSIGFSIEKDLELKTLQRSIADLALYVRSQTSWYYRFFSYNGKEHELQRISAEVMREDPPISQEKVTQYLLDIAHAAMRTRGGAYAGGRFQVTTSGAAFIKQVFYSNGRFTHLREYLSAIEIPVLISKAKDNKDLPSTAEKSILSTIKEIGKKNIENQSQAKHRSQEFSKLYEDTFTAAELELKEVSGCLFTSKKVERTRSEPAAANLFRRRVEI